MASVLLHEFGHVFGLAHVDEATHPNLVMSTNSTVCSYQDHHWGWGDYNNMTAHY
jgi:predicted Zn-dependent protease